MNLKPFDLEKALAGEPVITRDGRPVSEIYHFKTVKDSFPIRDVIDGIMHDHTVTGNHDFSGKLSKNDLFMAPVKREEWMNIYKSGKGSSYELGPCVHSSKEEAVRMVDLSLKDEYITTVKIREWED